MTIKTRIIFDIADILGTDPKQISDDASLDDMGLDSLDITSLQLTLERRFPYKLSSDLKKIDTVETILKKLL